MVYRRSDKTELRKDEKKKLIFEIAAKVFAAKGYHQTSVKDITDAAQISVGTFYLYFKNKEDLFEKLYDEMEQTINNAQSYALRKETKTPAERFVNAVAASIWTYQKYRELAKILLIEASGLNRRFEEKYAELMVKSCSSMEAVLKHLKGLGIIDVPDVKVAAVAYEGSFNYAITYWLRTEAKENLEIFAYPLTVYSLQALKIDFNKEYIKKSIEEMFRELDKEGNKFMQL